ncbi:MAG: long-chain acyl-CoA synthetase [Actinomycetota bacterium]|nr:long-chain acyl-CoA synthetase [Actinomycetota bacterium]
MREFSVPAMAASQDAGNLAHLIVHNSLLDPEAVVFARRAGDAWEDITCRQFRQEVESLARGLIDAGIEPGDRVGLMSRTRYEWTLFDFAIWTVGAVTVPVYETSSAEQASWILSDSGAVACLVETEEHSELIDTIRESLPGLRRTWVLERGAVQDLCSRGSHVADERVTERRDALKASSLATVIYTSGTSGRPKGCELTHGNFLHLADNTAARLGEIICAEGAGTLLFLPLAHVFARFIQILCVVVRARCGHSSNIKDLLPDLATFQPTFLLAVPRVFEKIYNSAEASADSSGKGRIFRAAARVAIQQSKSLDDDGPGWSLRVQHAVFDRLVYRQLRAALGGRIRCAVSGGAPMGEHLGHFFRGAGVLVMEGWGLTETTAPISVNPPEKIKMGTVGPPLPGVSVAVDDDGELLVRGLGVMHGYHNRPEETAQALHNGWFRTGDLGEIDEDGYVRITGRRKEIIVTAGGKNVSPMVLEDRIRRHPLISQCIVVGDRRPYVACLVTLDEQMLGTWLSNNGRPPTDVAGALKDPIVREQIQHSIDEANTAVSRAESIRRFTILDTDLTEAAGHLTPKQSLRRAAVLRDFAVQIDELYRA